MSLFMFKDTNGAFSWRKAGTAICFVLYAYCVIGYCITHKWDEIPMSYQVIMGMVFTFYFAKQALASLNVSSKPQ